MKTISQGRRVSNRPRKPNQTITAPRSKRIHDNRPPRSRRAASKTADQLRFNRILVPIDFSTESSRALKFALQLATRDNARLILVHVAGPVYYLRDYGLGPVPRRRVDEDLERTSKQRLQALGRRHIKSDCRWKVVVCSGTAPRQILKVADEAGIDLIVMPTRGLAHAPPSEIGSVAERVVRHARCPVLVLPSTHAARPVKP